MNGGIDSRECRRYEKTVHSLAVQHIEMRRTEDSLFEGTHKNEKRKHRGSANERVSVLWLFVEPVPIIVRRSLAGDIRMKTTSGDLLETSPSTRTCKVRGLLVVEAAKEP